MDDKNTTLGDDLLYGIKAIADFWGMPERKAYHLASKGLLPGVFKMGKVYSGSKSAARAAVRGKIQKSGECLLSRPKQVAGSAAKLSLAISVKAGSRNTKTA